MTSKVDAVSNMDYTEESDNTEESDHTVENQQGGTDSDTDYSYSDEESRNEWRNYLEQVKSGDYYNIDKMQKCRRASQYVPFDSADMSADETPLRMVEIAIKEHNRNENEQLVLEKVLKAVWCGLIWYLTFEARSSTSGDVKVYQARIYTVPGKQPVLRYMDLSPENQDSSKD